MIEINLISEELNIRNKSSAMKDPRFFVRFIPAAVGVLLTLHILLLLIFLINKHQFNTLNRRWASLEPQRKIAEGYRKEFENTSQDAQTIRQWVSQRINYAEKLNRLALDLPSGIWFNELVTSAKDITIKCSVVSLQKEEMTLVNKFMDNLKNDTVFFKDLLSLELSTVQRRVVGGYDIVDIVLTGMLKAK